MDRYRAYQPTDDVAQQDGDIGFIGVNDYDIAENLDAGQLQAGVNLNVTDATAATRGGFVGLPALALAPFGQYWVSRANSVDNTWTDVAYGNGVFVAVAFDGSFNQVMSSPDGITWTTRTTPSNNFWLSVVYGNGLFVAVASGAGVGDQVMTSPDGITWTSRTQAEANAWRGVTFGGGQFVAVSTNGTHRVMTSPDGITWSTQTAAVANNWKAVAYGGGLYAAVALTGTGNRVMTSPDAITWTARTSTADLAWQDITYGNGLFVAIASDGTGNNVMTSPDGITWTARTSASDNDWQGITYGGAQFVAVANTGTGDRVMTSSDGKLWTARASAVDNAWNGVAFGAGRYVAVGSTGTLNRVMTADSQTVWASGLYSDPNAASSEWTVLAGATNAKFVAFGQTSRTIAYPASYVVSQQSTIVQANNLLFIFAGSGQTPIQWDGNWSGAFIPVPAAVTSGNDNIPHSNQATYYQNRLWVVNGKDEIAASDILTFTDYDPIAGDFNLNTGSSDYVVTSYPFGDNGLVIFKHKSSILLQNVQGSLADVTATEVTRQLGIIGINAAVTVGPDLVYMSDRNITSVRLNLQNQLQHATQPLSRNIRGIMSRVNWAYAYKVSMAYWDNSLYVALPVDNATSCNIVVVYNYITEQWWGEWNFAAELNLTIQGFVVANYQGAIRLHAVSEDGRLFVTGEGQNDISGTILSEISTSMTTRAYRLDNNSHVPRRMWMDIATNRPNFTVTAYAEGASESNSVISRQTYSRANSWIFADAAYAMNNSNDDYNRAFRQDYSSGPDSIQSGSGFQPEMRQAVRFPLITRRKGRLSWFKIQNTQGFMDVTGVGVEARAGDRGSLVQVG